jgi:hypothetical protein
MATDARGKTVPASTDHPARSAFLNLALSIRDPIVVSDATTRGTALSTLAALSPAITPSASNPIFFYQQDLPKGYRTIYTVDGTNFFTLAGMYIWADATARGAATGPSTGDLGLQVDTLVTYRHNGSAWKEWASDWSATYAPTLTNFTIGTGGSVANVAQYRYSNGRVQMRGYAKLGTSGASVSGGIIIALPVNRAALNHNWQGFKGVAEMYDDSTGTNYLAFVAANNTAVNTVMLLSPGTNGLRTGSGASTPFTWAAADAVSYDFEYDPA